MRNNDWRGVVNTIVYSVQFNELTDELAAQQAQRLIEKPAGHLTNDEQYAALNQAVKSGSELTQLCPDAHSESAIRTFLSTILAEMDNLRPWQEPEIQAVDIRKWEHLENLTPIGFLMMSVWDIQPRVKQVFDADSEGRRVCLLQLRSGVQIALATNWWPESSNIAILTESATRSSDILTELCAVTALDASEVHPFRNTEETHDH